MRSAIKNKKAYTLVEILVGFFIILMGLVGYLSLTIKTLALEPIGKNKLIASQLAQEGIEIVRNIRDTNWINGESFDRAINGNALDYSMVLNNDTSIADIESIPADYYNPDNWLDSDTVLHYDSSSKSYLHDLTSMINNPTGFKRIIHVNPICDCPIPTGCCTGSGSGEYICPDTSQCPGAGQDKIGIQIRSIVQWKEHSRRHEVEVVSQIFDWIL